MNERNDTNGVYFYYFIHILYRQYIGSTMIFTHHHTYVTVTRAPVSYTHLTLPTKRIV